MTHSRLQGLIAHLPEGVTEIYTHPATASDFAGAAPGYRYEEELAALTSPDLRRHLVGGGRCFRRLLRRGKLRPSVNSQGGDDGGCSNGNRA